LFLLIGLGGVQSSLTSASDPNGVSGAPIMSVLYSSASMGLALLVSVWLFYRVTGGLFNPNVSFAMLLIGAINPIRFLMYVIAQFLGAIVASALLQALLPGPLQVK
jgi:aquaporin related protein